MALHLAKLGSRRIAIVALLRAGYSVEEILATVRASRRTIYRDIELIQRQEARMASRRAS